MTATTPMMKQYLATKKAYPDAFLFFRLGDFYEMFFDDAIKGAELLDITLTARGKNQGDPIPMCGVPYHSAQGYINRLTQLGHKVAICEQVEDPALAKGIVKREIIKLITPGTNLEDDSQPSLDNQYIASYYSDKNGIGLSYLDLATGEYYVFETGTEQAALNQLALIQPKELICTESVLSLPSVRSLCDKNPSMSTTSYDAWVFDLEHAKELLTGTFALFSLQGLGLAQYVTGIQAAGALIYYLREHLFKDLRHLKPPRPINKQAHLSLDRATIENLGLFPNQNRQLKGHSLFEIINKTKTTMGNRLLAKWLREPLLNITEIDRRLNVISALTDPPSLISRLQSLLKYVRDIERILSRLTCGISNPRDLVSLKESLRQVPLLKETLKDTTTKDLLELDVTMTPFDELVDLLERSIIETPPVITRNGGFIKKGFNAKLDDLKSISLQARTWIAELQSKEIKRTGIKSLKIKFNKVFGYYIEISKANLAMAPADYERKQTLVNAERFTIPQLKEYEEKILGADEHAVRLEIELFEGLRAEVLAVATGLQVVSAAIARLDALTSLAQSALENDYARPTLTDNYDCTIKGGRHPVVEKTLPGNAFVENDVVFNSEDRSLLVITGPNMSGKSTYLRQNALIVILAQMGSFVPAAQAEIGLVDKIFTRIGASDNLSVGESTFMVEMIETANILNNATSKSLIIMDEVGRGTSTFDGVSIAWAICEFFAEQQKTPKVLFATHYHELSELENYFGRIKNFNAAVKDDKNGIVFLRKIVPGAADKSYGIHVAELAGLPRKVTERAKEVLTFIEQEKHDKEEMAERIHQRTTKRIKQDISTLPLFQSVQEDHPALKELRQIDANAITPLEALNILHRLTKDVKNNINA
ncbi:MAG: DNA mismatch repair protein MutS [Candidatus Omnitrophica bacterium]|nr:DNA mismatch repair protein MutS [Candidatus Omnitrophota bacterium]